MKKKTLALLLVLMTAAVTFSACGSSTEENTTENTSDEAEDSEEEASDSEEESEEDADEEELDEAIAAAETESEEMVRADADEEAAEVAELSGSGTETDPYVMSFDNMTAAYEGNWYETGLGFDVLIPDIWTETDLSDVENAEEDGVTAQYASEDGELKVTITSVKAGDVDELTAVYEELEQTDGVSNAAYAEINGLQAIEYESEGSRTVVMLDEDGNRNSVILTAENFEEYEELIADMIYSISATE